jgi:hypothetical protein
VDVNEITFASGKYFRCTDSISSINTSIPAGLKNTMCLFSTGTLNNFSILIDPSYKINKAFDFKSNTSYVIGIDNYTILWTKLETIKG